MLDFIKTHKLLLLITIVGLIALVAFAFATNWIAAVSLFVVLFANNVSLNYSALSG